MIAYPSQLAKTNWDLWGTTREQAEGKVHDTGPAADVYALGALLYELLAGRPPFKGETAFETIRQVLAEEPVPPSRLRPGTSRDLETICLKCLRKQPAQRYASAEDLADDLRRYRSGEPIAARPAGKVERLIKWVKRRPAAAAVLALVGVLIAVVFVAFGLVATQLRETKAALDAKDREQKQREKAEKEVAAQLSETKTALAAKDREQKQREKAEKERALARVNALCDAAPGAVPGLLVELEATRDEVLPRLRELWNGGAKCSAQQRRRAGLALLPVEPDAVRAELADWLLKADDPAEVLLVRNALTPHKEKLHARFWDLVEDAKAKPAERFRALVALAAFDPKGEQWAKQAPAAVEQMLAANPLHLGTWVAALQPVGEKLLKPLGEVFRTAKAPERREFAATVLADYAGKKPDVLADLLLDADARQFAVLLPKLREFDTAAAMMQRELAKVPTGSRQDAPLDSAWSTVDADLRGEIERADGMLAERFALVQTLPLVRFAAVAEALRKSGYRPIRLRPYNVKSDVLTAAVWTRDGRDWQTAVGLKRVEVNNRDAINRTKLFTLVDLAGYRTSAAESYTALWCASSKVADQQLFLGVVDAYHDAVWRLLRDGKYVPCTYQKFLSQDGKTLNVEIWQKPDEWTVDWQFCHGNVHYYETQLSQNVALLQVDVGLRSGAETLFTAVWHTIAKLEAAESHGLDPAAHLARCRQLASEGYRPAALTAASLLNGEPTTTASVWHRPVVQDVEREALAKRQANGAAALLRLGLAEPVWPLFRHTPDPTRRSELLARLVPLGIEAKQVADRLQKDEEKDVSARRALILALGEYTGEQLPSDVRDPLTAKLLDWYRNDPDAGIHGAVDWLLRHGKEGPIARPLDWGQAAKLKQIDTELKRSDPDETRSWYVNGQGQTMVVVPGPVEFRMGSPLTEPTRRTWETPHLRSIDRKYAIASRSVTKEEFQRFRKDRPDVLVLSTLNQYSPDADTPMVGVTWYEAAQYCNWLSEQEGLPESEWCYPKHADIKDGMPQYSDYLKRKGYRLPTEAEWEYSARGNASTSRYFGSSLDLLPRYAWYFDNSEDRAWPVGQKRPNDFGMFDGLGNICNWTNDQYLSYPQQLGTKANPDVENAAIIKESNDWVLRGGAFINPASYVRLAFRADYHPSWRNGSVGMRPARTLP